MNAVIMSKDDDFVRLVDQLGIPPSIIWITCGNTSNAQMRELLNKHLLLALDLINAGEPLIEIGER